MDPALYVVRCYAHISEWSLRASAAGRTQEWRQKLKDGRKRAEEEGPRVISPAAQVIAVDLAVDDDDVDYTPYWRTDDGTGT